MFYHEFKGDDWSVSGLYKDFSVGFFLEIVQVQFFLGAIKVRSDKLCTAITPVELDTYIPVSLTLMKFQDHRENDFFFVFLVNSAVPIWLLHIVDLM